LCSAHSFACTNISEAYFVISETYNPEGLKKFGDNVNRDTYQLRRIVAGQYTTQPANSVAVNATRYEYQTKTRVSQTIEAAIAALVNSAPSTLDTLNELAAALGDDPNFATTIVNSLGNKVDKVAGYGLSKNDLTDALVSSIAGKLDKITAIISVSSNTTIDASYAGKIIEASGTITITCPNSLPAGMRCDVINVGTGVITIAAESLMMSRDGKNKLSSQYGGASFYNRGGNNWLLVGDLTV
jgi:hypothetical protein